MNKLFRLDGKTALITGASGDFGQYFADVLGRAGARVILASRNPEKLEEKLNELRKKGINASALELNVSDAKSVDLAINNLAKENTIIDILINNAGAIRSGRFIDESDDDVVSIFNTNVHGAARVARAVARQMAARRQGVIVNVGSTAGLRIGGFMSTYGASKAALIHMTQTMALELAGRGVRVNALCPGNFETAMHGKLASVGFDERIKSRIPMRRLGVVPELEGPLLLLTTDAGSYVNGACLVVDGGQTLSWQ